MSGQSTKIVHLAHKVNTKNNTILKPWRISSIKNVFYLKTGMAQCVIYHHIILVVRASTHCVAGHWINPAWWTHWDISRSSQWSTTRITKIVVCTILHINHSLLLIRKSSPCSGTSGFPLSYSVSSPKKLTVTGRRKEGNVLFNDALNIFYLRLYGIKHMVKDHSDSGRGNLLLPHGILFPISSKGSFICIIPQTG